MAKKIQTGWGSGSSDLYLNIKGGKPEILDYEFDTDRLHETCGGKCYYTSRSGASGAGYFNSLGSLVRLGLYRVDTAHNNEQWFTQIGKTQEDWEEQEVLVAVPYRSHEKDKAETLRSHPTVIKVGNKVVYCDFDTNFLEVLGLLFSGEDLTKTGKYVRTLRRTFTRVDQRGAVRFEKVVLEHYNLCSMDNTPSPWEFFQCELENCQAGWDQERLFRLLSVERLENGTFVKTFKVDDRRYRGEILPGDPLETGDLTAGWQRLAEDVLIRFYDGSNEAHLVAYAKADEVYGALGRRLAAKMGEGEEFISFVSAHGTEYAEFELVVPKVLYLLDPAAQLAEVRKGLARKVREDVFSQARQWIDEVNDQSILEAIPDDLVVTFDDSLEAGNCRPGTESFRDQYFPGQTSTTAGELKKYADNYNIMRIFRHLAITRRFDYRAKTLGE